MIVKHTAEGLLVDRASFDFSEEEEKRIKEILDELKCIFQASSVGLSGEFAMGQTTNFKIDLFCCPNPGYQWKPCNDFLCKESRRI